MRGNKSDNSLIYVTINRTTIIAIKKGIIYFMLLVTVVSAIPQPTNKQVPTGGVHTPIHKFMIIMMPKWIGLTPSAFTMGRKIGVNINTAGVMSIKVPTNNNIRLIIRRMIILLEEIPSRLSLML